MPVAEKTHGLFIRALESADRGSDVYNVSDLHLTDPAEFFGEDAKKIHTEACSFCFCANVYIYTATGALPALVRTLRHNYDEYEFLAQILPDLYEEEKDNWV